MTANNFFEKVNATIEVLGAKISKQAEEEGKIWIDLTFKNGLMGEFFIMDDKTPGTVTSSFKAYAPWKMSLSQSGTVLTNSLKSRTETWTKGLLLEAAEWDAAHVPTGKEVCHAEKNHQLMMEMIASVEALS